MVYTQGWGTLIFKESVTKPQGYEGKGLDDRGQGMECLTPHKPLPLSEGKGIPQVYPQVSPVTFVGVCHSTNIKQTFYSQQPTLL
jgi:hypothetical protein